MSFQKKHGVDPIISTMPSYMRPLQSRSRTLSSLTTIEAFTVETKKKKNLWEDAVEDKDEQKFKSTSRPTARLTAYERKQLKIGHSLHKPTHESIASFAEISQLETSSSKGDGEVVSEFSSISSPPHFSQTTLKEDSSLKQRYGKVSSEEDSIFVTQMSSKDLDKAHGRTKTVTFGEVKEVNPQKSNNRKSHLPQASGDVRTSGAVKSEPSSSVGIKGTALSTKRPQVSYRDKDKKAKSFFSVILNHDQ